MRGGEGMTWMAYLLEEARKIIRNCEDVQESSESTFAKESEQRSAYRQLKELLLPEREEP